LFSVGIRQKDSRLFFITADVDIAVSLV